MRKAKKALSLGLVLVMILSLVPAIYAAGHPFADVPAGSWFDAPVEFCYTNGLMNGTSPTTFQPSLEMSRAMLVTVLYRMDGSQKVNGSVPFTDVASDAYYADAVAWAYQNGVVNGTSPTTFTPNANITREQLVTIFYRYTMDKEYAISGYADLSGYSDNGRISVFAKAAFRWAVADGIIQGTSATQLSPAGTANRAQCATIIQRFVKWTEENSKPEATDPSVPVTAPSEPSTEPSEPETQPADPNEPHTHDFSYSKVIDYEPTCTSDGRQTLTCACGIFVYEAIPATGHSLGEPEVIEATCLAFGYTVRTCHCGYCEKYDYIQKLNHDYQLIDSKVADCTTAGYETYKCVNGCEVSYTNDYAALGHDWEHEHTDEVGHWADCLLVCTCGWSCSQSAADEEGITITEYWSCYHQDYYGANQGSYNDHSYSWTRLTSDWVIDTPAYDKWTCSRCEISTEDHDEVTGHELLTGQGHARCKDGAVKLTVCGECDYRYEETVQESTGHIWGDWEITQEVTDESRGWAIRTCTDCGYDMGDYADRVLEILDNGGCYHSHKPEMQSVCINCGVDTNTLPDWTPSPWIPRK